jgi:hypothetical protein
MIVSCRDLRPTASGDRSRQQVSDGEPRVKPVTLPREYGTREEALSGRDVSDLHFEAAT